MIRETEIINCLSAKFNYIVVYAVFYSLDCALAPLNLVDDGFFAFEGFIDGEEVTHFVKYMSGQLGNILVFVIIRVVERDRDYLLIELAASFIIITPIG